MAKKITAERLRQLLEEFNQTILPWCEENELSLHEAFERSRETDQEKYKVLSEIWGTYAGKMYLRSLFKERGGRA
jgi:hypothetical protein